jgi:hypothetical protein
MTDTQDHIQPASKWWLASRRGAGGASAAVGLLALVIAAVCESYGVEISEAWSLEAAALVLALGGGAIHAWGKRRAKKTLRLRRKERVHEDSEYADPLHTTVLTRDGRYPWAEDTKRLRWRIRP